MVTLNLGESHICIMQTVVVICITEYIDVFNAKYSIRLTLIKITCGVFQLQLVLFYILLDFSSP